MLQQYTPGCADFGSHDGTGLSCTPAWWRSCGTDHHNMSGRSSLRRPACNYTRALQIPCPSRLFMRLFKTTRGGPKREKITNMHTRGGELYKGYTLQPSVEDRSLFSHMCGILDLHLTILVSGTLAAVPKSQGANDEACRYNLFTARP